MKIEYLIWNRKNDAYVVERSPGKVTEFLQGQKDPSEFEVQTRGDLGPELPDTDIVLTGDDWLRNGPYPQIEEEDEETAGLYEVEINYKYVVRADDWTHATQVAERTIKDVIENDEKHFDVLVKKKITSLEELPEGWNGDSLPYTDNENAEVPVRYLLNNE